MSSHHAEISRVSSSLVADLWATGRRPGSPRNRVRLPRSELTLAVAPLLAAFALGCAILAIEQLSLEWGITSVLLAAVASLGAISASVQARRVGMLLPLSFIGLWAVGYGLASFAWRDPSSELFTRNLAQLRHDSVPLGLAVAAVGLLAWTAGYSVLQFRLVRAGISALRKWSTSGVSRPGQPDYSLRRIIGIYIVGLGARLVLLALGRYSYITADLQGATTQSSPIVAVLSHLEFFTTVALLLFAYTCFISRTTIEKWMLTLALAVEVPFGLLSGMRSFILLRLLGVAITYILVRRRLPPAAPIALVFVLAVLSPFTDAYRGEVRDATGTTVGVTAAADLIPTLLGRTLEEISPRDVISSPSDFVTNRLRFVDEVAMVAQRTPSEIAHIPPDVTALEATTVLIPRAAWAGKPVYTTGLTYARNFWNQPDSVVSSRSPTYPGDAYYRGGWPGLLILMALLGGVMAVISRSLSPRRYPAAVPMFIVAWTELMDIEGSLSLLGAGLVQSLLLTAVAMRWASSSGRSRMNADRRLSQPVGPRSLIDP